MGLTWHRLFPDLAGLGDWMVIKREVEFKATVSYRK